MADHILERLRRSLAEGAPLGEEELPIAYEEYTPDGSAPTPEQQKFLDDLQRVARERLQKLFPPDGLEPRPVNAQYEVLVSRSGLAAWLFSFPPQNGGDASDTSEILELLQKRGVVYGVDTAAVERAASGGTWFQLIPAAAGTPPVDGRDGQIVDRIPREQKANIREAGDNERVDYKNLNWLRNIHQGDVICDIVPPVEPTPGRAVSGRVLEGRRGVRPVVPMGRNTSISEDGLTLVSNVDGQVFFRDGRFQVDQILTIHGDLDITVGNLDVLGDLIIQGDLREGFVVKATGNIVVHGLTEGATLLAGGSVSLKRGMNGNNRGVVEAKGDVFAKYLENCTITAGGCIRADSLINCNSSSNDKIIITSGRGVIIGGSVMACHAVEATVIGNQSHRSTTIVIGATSSFLQEKAQVAEDVRRLEHEMDGLEKNLAYLGTGTLPPEYMKLRDKLRLQLSVTNIQYNRRQKRLTQMDAEQQDMQNCYVESSMIYPLTQITIGRESKIISAITPMCRIRYGPDGITVGLKTT